MEKYQKTDYKGIDYSGIEDINIDTKTMIRYGVIPINHVERFWDEAVPIYSINCPYCGYEFEEEPEELICPFCKEKLNEDEIYSLEPISWEYEDNEYKLIADETDIFVIKSPYYTYAQFCSPCAPGACYLPNPLSSKDDNNKCYCLDESWFYDNKAPYEYWRIDNE